MGLATWLWIAFSILAALIFAALVWLGGPLIFISGSQPLEGVVTRTLIIAVIWLIIFGTMGWRVYIRRRRAKELEKAMTAATEDESDAGVLKGKMEDAIATLKRAHSGRAEGLYDLPWYLIIGPPGAGKTTALVNSGLKFPLAGPDGSQFVAGVGGTRYCDWWFTDQAVMIDTAGRYTTQDSDAKVDRKSWLAFLAMLKNNRPRQPINGVIVAISIADVLGLSATEVNAHADAIRKRLDELHAELKVSFPVYAVFTKMDLISGFMQYFADLDEAKRAVVWGATFQTADKKANLVAQAPAEMDLLIQRIVDRMPERLQDEPDPRARAILYGLPAQLSAIRKPVTEFLNRIFEPTRYQSVATLRGFYFTSATQDGTPFDSVIGALRKSFGVESLGPANPAGPGRSYFLSDLLTKVIFAEAGWVSTNIAAVRRSFAIRAAAFAAIGAATAAVAAIWWVSYTENAALIASTSTHVDQYVAAAGPAIGATKVDNADIGAVYDLVDGLPGLPVGYARRAEPTPLFQTFGLSQRSRVEDASLNVYHDALERMMRPRLLLRLEQLLQKNIDQPLYVYEALKIYLMLGGQADTVDKTAIVNWFVHDWEEIYPGAPNAPARARLQTHLEAMLDLDRGAPIKIALNGPLIEKAQATLARMPIAERAYTLLKSESHKFPIQDWIASEHGGIGSNMALVFEGANGVPLDSIKVPAFFTYGGFYLALWDRIPSIEQTLNKEKWVLGPAATQGPMSAQYSSLHAEILERYTAEFIAAWNGALGELQLRPMLADKPQYLALSAISAPTSPMLYLLESIRDETALTRERKGQAKIDSSVARQAEQDAINLSRMRMQSQFNEAIDLAWKNQSRAGEFARDQSPAAGIENAFKQFTTLVDGEPGSRKIDSLLVDLNKLYVAMTAAAANPNQAQQMLAEAQVDLASLRANKSRVPEPIRGWIEKIASEAAKGANAMSMAELADSLAENVTAPCHRIIDGHYPFASGGSDVPLADFGRLFMPNGIIDHFFASSLAPLVDQTGKTMAWRPQPDASKKLSDATLRAFQMAADIRDTFFPTGGSQPNVNFEVRLQTINANAQTATLIVNGGNPFVAQSGAPTAAVVNWPGAGPSGASIALAPDMPDQKSTLERQGPWALFHLVDYGSATPRGGVVNVGFVVGQRDVSYQFSVQTANNPLKMPALRQFKCPTGL